VSDPLNDPAVRRKLAVLRHVDEVIGNVGDDLSSRERRARRDVERWRIRR